MKMKQKIKQIWKKFQARGGYFYERSALISMVSLAYIINKDFVLIASEAIKNNILVPYYCVKYEEKDGEDVYLCKKKTFYTCLNYSSSIENYYFLLDDVINLERMYNIVSNNFSVKMRPTEENITTPQNIRKILKRTLRKISIPWQSSTPQDNFSEFLFNLFLIMVLLSSCCYNFIKRHLTGKKQYLLEESDEKKIMYLFEEQTVKFRKLITAEEFPILYYINTLDITVLENFIKTHPELTKTEIGELVFYFSFQLTNEEIAEKFKVLFPDKSVSKQSGSRYFKSFKDEITDRKYKIFADIFPLQAKEQETLYKIQYATNA
jgi:hypothetical protein